MQRSGQGGDRAGHRAVHVRQRRRDHPRREGRGVQLVVGVEDQRYVERALHVLLRGLAGDEVERVGRERQAAPRTERLLLAAQPVERPHHGRQLRDQPDGLAILGSG